MVSIGLEKIQAHGMDCSLMATSTMQEVVKKESTLNLGTGKINFYEPLNQPEL